MLRPPQASRITVLARLAILCVHPVGAQHTPTIGQNLKPGYPQGFVSLLRAHHVIYDLPVLTDDMHETLLHRRWLDFFGKMESWLDRYRIMPEASSR